MNDRAARSQWVRAVLLPAALAALVPCATALARLVDPGTAIPRLPHHLYGMCFGLLVAWAGWRVVRRSSSRALGAMLAGATTFLAGVVPAAIAASLVTSPGFHPATWFMGSIVVAAISVAAMFLGWLGGTAAALWTRRHPA